MELLSHSDSEGKAQGDLPAGTDVQQQPQAATSWQRGVTRTGDPLTTLAIKPQQHSPLKPFFRWDF